MYQNHYFRILFSYQNQDENTGKLKKEKKEVLVSAVNYTDAECLALVLLPSLQQHSDDASYRINLVDKPMLIVLTNNMSVDDTLTQGLFNYYFEESPEAASLFKVTVHIAGMKDNGGLKTTKEDWWVPAVTSKQAYDTVQSLFSSIETRDFAIKNITCDVADEIFVTEQGHKSILHQSESANLI